MSSPALSEISKVFKLRLGDTVREVTIMSSMRKLDIENKICESFGIFSPTGFLIIDPDHSAFATEWALFCQKSEEELYSVAPFTASTFFNLRYINITRAVQITYSMSLAEIQTAIRDAFPAFPPNRSISIAIAGEEIQFPPTYANFHEYRHREEYQVLPTRYATDVEELPSHS